MWILYDDKQFEHIIPIPEGLSFDLSENARKVLERGIRIGDRLIEFPKTKTN